MDYRKLPHGGEAISILGLGTSSIGMAGDKEIEATMTMALENGVNYFDMASADAAPFSAFGRALAGNRKMYTSKSTLARTIRPENMDGPPIWTPLSAPLTGS